MKRYAIYLIVFMMLMMLSACVEKRVVSMPRTHLPPPPPHQPRPLPPQPWPDQLTPRQPPEPLPGISGPRVDQGIRTTEPAAGGTIQDHSSLLSAVRPVQRRRPEVLTRMIRRAETQLSQKQPQLAFSTLEQALYIDGQDPLIWHLMARACLSQGNTVQAVSLAKKSNSLATAYPEVKAKNAALLRQAQGYPD